MRGNLKISTNVHGPFTECSGCDEEEKAQKIVIVTDYIWHMGYVDKGDRMANSYSVSQRTWKWIKNFSTSWT